MKKSPESASIMLSFKALGNSVRIQMIEFLLEKKEANCNEFVQHIGMAQSTISEHLFELKKSGIFLRKSVGRNSIYTINELQIFELKLFLEKLLQKSEEKQKIEKIKKRKSGKNLKEFNYQFQKKKPS